MDGEGSSTKRRTISEIHKAMDFRSEGKFPDALEWLNFNLEWINSILQNGKLEVNHDHFSIQKGNHNLQPLQRAINIELSHDEWISASNSLITLFEDHAALFGQLACLKVNWELGFFMDNDVKYLKDYLKAYSISIQDPTLYLQFRSNPAHSAGPIIENVYSLCYYLGSFSTGICQEISEDFLLPVLLFMKLMSEAGFFRDDLLLRYLTVRNDYSEIEEGIMLVFGDGDVDSAIDTLIHNYLYGPKQGIWLMKKVLVQETVYDYFIKSLLKQIDKIAFPPLHYDKKLDKLDKFISDAKSVGIEVYETTFSKTGMKGPMIFNGEPPSCAALNQNDLRLPFIAAQPFRTAEECITLANKNIHCSNASLWTESQSLAMKVHNLLRMYSVWLNAHGLMDPLVPVYCPKREKRYISIKWDMYCASVSGYHDEYRHQEITNSTGIHSKQTIQKAEKATKEWQKVDVLQRAKILSDIAYNFRQRTASDEAQHAADIFFHFAEECLRCTHSTSIVTKKGIYQVSFEPLGIVGTALRLDLNNNFEVLALFAAPLICYGSSMIISIYAEDRAKYLEFQEILLSSGLPENLFNFDKPDPTVLDDMISVNGINRIIFKLRELLVAGKYSRNSFNFVLRALSYHASLPKVLWIPK